MKPTAVLLLVLALAGSAPAIDSLNVRLTGFYLTEAERIAVEREYACILAFHVGLRLVSVADPAHMFEVGQFDDTSCGFSQAIVDTDYVYLPHHPSGVRVISIADPAHPVEVGSLNTPVSVGDIAVAGQYAYMTGGNQLLVVSVADPVNPVIVARCDTSDSAVSDVAVSGNYAYVMDYRHGLKVISVADPLHPVEVGHCDLTGMYGSVAVSGSYVWAGGVGDPWQSMIISVADPANPTAVESLPYFYTDVIMDGDTVYVAAGLPGLRIISLKDTAPPLELGYYHGVGTAQGVALSRGYIFVAAGSALLILQYYQSGVEENFSSQITSRKLLPTVIRSLPQGAVAYDAMGRRVMNPRSGVLFVQERSGVSGEPSAASVRKVVVTR